MISLRRASRRAPAPGPGRFRRLAHVLSRFTPLVLPHRRQLALGGLCTLGFILTGLLVPWPIQAVIDGVLLDRKQSGILAWVGPLISDDPATLLLACCAAVIAIAGLNGLFSYGQRIITKAVGHRVVAEMRMRVFAKLQRLSLSFHRRSRSGDLLVRMTGDVAMLREILVPALLEAASGISVLLGMTALMAFLDLRLTLVALAMVPLLGAATLRFGSRIREVAREQRRKEGKIATVAGEALASVAVVQAYSQEGALAARFSRQNNRSLRAGLRSVRLEESLSRIVELTLAAGTALVLWMGARRVIGGGMSPGVLVVFLSYLRGIYKPIQSLTRIYSRASKATACGERVLEVLDSGEEVRESPHARPAPALAGEIVFENVRFGYDPARPVLHGVSFAIAPGEKVGLVGPSGSGKSTILSLLLRLHEPQEGRVLVDGHDIRDFRLESYRRQIAVVLQDPFLFGISVEENIRCGDPEASDERVAEAARVAGAGEFSLGLPEGFATELGERGATLSRGQQQRIALARAVVREAPILVFDEPTTGLDARTEREVVQTLSTAANGRTCVWIAHRLGQILDCTRVLVLRDGRLVQEGDPAVLLRRHGALHTLFEGAAS